MKNRILFIGTSFLGAIKQGYDSIFSSACEATFVGFRAPDLAAHLTSGWYIKENVLHFSPELCCFVSGYNQLGMALKTANKTFPGTEEVSGLAIDICNYSSIVFVDMFYRLYPAFTVNVNFFPILNGCPVSDCLLSELKSSGLNGWVSLNQHVQYGNVPFVNSKKLLTAISGVFGEESVYLMSAPRPPAGNVDIQARYNDIATAQRSFDFLERFYAIELARHGIEYLPQPIDVLDNDRCLTRSVFSRGEHPKKAGTLDQHMNQKYGEAILLKYFEKIIS